MAGADRAARAAAAGRAHDPPRPAAGDGHPQRHARQLLRRRPVRRCGRGRRGRRAHGGRRARRSSTSAANRRGRARSRSGKATRSSASCRSSAQLAGGGAAVSIDTRKAAVMEAALGAGARLVNDVSALTFDPRAAAVVAAAGVPGRADAPPGRAGDDAGRSALRRRAGRGLSMAGGADRGGGSGGHRAREHPRRSRASASARRSPTISS